MRQELWSQWSEERSRRAGAGEWHEVRAQLYSFNSPGFSQRGSVQVCSGISCAPVWVCGFDATRCMHVDVAMDAAVPYVVLQVSMRHAT